MRPAARRRPFCKASAAILVSTTSAGSQLLAGHEGGCSPFRSLPLRSGWPGLPLVSMSPPLAVQLGLAADRTKLFHLPVCLSSCFGTRFRLRSGYVSDQLLLPTTFLRRQANLDRKSSPFLALADVLVFRPAQVVLPF